MDALIAELTAGHPDTGAYSADATTAVTELNAKNRTRYAPVTSRQLLSWCAGGSPPETKSRMVRLREAEASGVEAIKGIASAALLMITRDGTALDLSDASHFAMLGALVSASVFTAAEQTELQALATESISRAEELGLGVVKPGHVEEARRLAGA